MAVTFTYVASGKLSLSKCGTWYSVDGLYVRNIAFSVGDEGWIRYRAERGVLEKIVIKKIKLLDYTYKGGGLAYVLYVDTFNAIYNEGDLIYYEDAVALAENYLRQREALEAAAECFK